MLLLFLKCSLSPFSQHHSNFKITFPGFCSFFSHLPKIEVGLIDGLFRNQLHMSFGGTDTLLCEVPSWVGIVMLLGPQPGNSLGASGRWCEMPEILRRQVSVKNGKCCTLWHLCPSLCRKVNIL